MKVKPILKEKLAEVINTDLRSIKLLGERTNTLESDKDIGLNEALISLMWIRCHKHIQNKRKRRYGFSQKRDSSHI